MVSTPSRLKSYWPAIITIAALVIVGIIAGFVYLTRPMPQSPSAAPASREVKAYVSHLKLSNVTIKAAENFMQQKVVEVEGRITNAGPRTLRGVDVYCIFYGVDGREVHRERASVVPATAAPLKPDETRAFRLPFDTLPEGWNQAIPVMAIANINFAS
jgi:hypothetical protein